MVTSTDVETAGINDESVVTMTAGDNSSNTSAANGRSAPTNTTLSALSHLLGLVRGSAPSVRVTAGSMNRPLDAYAMAQAARPTRDVDSGDHRNSPVVVPSTNPPLPREHPTPTNNTPALISGGDDRCRGDDENDIISGRVEEGRGGEYIASFAGEDDRGQSKRMGCSGEDGGDHDDDDDVGGGGNDGGAHKGRWGGQPTEEEQSSGEVGLVGVEQAGGDIREKLNQLVRMIGTLGTGEERGAGLEQSDASQDSANPWRASQLLRVEERQRQENQRQAPHPNSSSSPTLPQPRGNTQHLLVPGPMELPPPTRTITVHDVCEKDVLRTISRVGSAVVIIATHFQRQTTRGTAQDEYAGYGILFITMDRELTSNLELALSWVGVKWRLCKRLPELLRETTTPLVATGTSCGNYVQATVRDKFVNVLNTLDVEDLESGNDDDDDAFLSSDISMSPLLITPGLRKAASHRDMEAAHIDCLSDSPLRDVLSGHSFFGDDMSKYLSAFIRMASINVRGAVWISDDMAAKYMDKIFQYLTSMRVSVAGLSEVDCTDPTRAGLLRSIAKKHGYSMVVSTASKKANSSALAWCEGITASDHDISPCGKGVGARLLFPFGAMYCSNIYGQSGGTGNNREVRTAEQKVTKWADGVFAMAKNRGDTLVALGDHNSIAEEIDAVRTQAVVRPDSVISKLRSLGLVDIFRYLHSDEVAFTHPASADGPGNRLDYALLSVGGCVSMVRAGIHKAPFLPRIWPFDHYIALVDVVSHGMEHDLGLRTGEKQGKLKGGAFVRLCQQKAMEEKDKEKLKAVMGDMYLSQQMTRTLITEIENSRGKSVDVQEEVVSRAGHLLAYAAMEVARRISGVSSDRPFANEADPNAIFLHRMALACLTFEESSSPLEDRSTTLLQASCDWAGRGVNYDAGSARGNHLTMNWELRQVIEGRPTPTEDELLATVSKVHKDCINCLDFISGSESREREAKMDKALEEGNMRALFQLDSGRDIKSIASAATLLVRVTTREDYRQKCDEDAAALRRAGADRPLSALIREANNVWGDTTVYVPLEIFFQEHCPFRNEVAMCFDSCNLDDKAMEILVGLVQQLWKLRKEREEIAPLLMELTRSTSVEEVRRISIKWLAKAKGVSPLSISMILCLPEVYCELLVQVTNAQLNRGVCLRTLCEVLLVMLAKPDGGKRGIALVNELTKLPPAIIMDRLSRLQRIFPSGTMCSSFNVAYQRSLSTAHVWDTIDYHACKARLSGLILFLLEYDFFKFFDQIDRRTLVAWMMLAGFPLVMVVAFSRRYAFQKLVCATACGITAGFMRAWFGIDQGASDSPFWSQLFQLAYLMALTEGLNLLCPGGHFITAFADNHWIGVTIPSDNVGLFVEVMIFISTLLSMCGLVVKPTSVNVRILGDISAAREVNLGSLTTTNHLDGQAVTITPHRVGEDESLPVLGVLLDGTGRWEDASAARHSCVWFHIRHCLLRPRRLRFNEVMLRNGVYSRSQYAAPFAYLAWEDVAKISQHVDRHRRRQLGAAENTKLKLLMKLPVLHGGMNLSGVNLELSTIPMVRGVDELLNRADPEAMDRADYISTPSANKFTTANTRRRIEQAMIQLSPYGIAWIDQKYQIIGRALAILREQMAAAYKGAFSIVPLHEIPTEDQVLTHSMYVVGGALHAMLVHLWADIKPRLQRIVPLTCPTPYDRLLERTYTRPPLDVRTDITNLLWERRAGCPGFRSLRGFAVKLDWDKVAWSLVLARMEADYDILLQRIAAGLPQTTERFDPDWVDGTECPLVAMLDDESPLTVEEMVELRKAYDEGHNFLIGTDGSMASAKDSNGRPTHTISASAAVVLVVVKGCYRDWMSMSLVDVERAVAAMFGAPFPVATGHENSASFHVEAMAVLLRLRIMAADETLRGAMERSLTLVDAASIIDKLTGLISSEVQGVIDPTSKEISNGPAPYLMRRIIRIMRTFAFSRRDVNAPTNNTMAQASQDCRKHNSVTNQTVCTPAQFTIGRSNWMWLRAHQQGQSGAGPCSAMVSVNHLADKLATEAAKTAPVLISLPKRRVTKKQKKSRVHPPVTYADHTLTMKEGDVNVVKIAAASARFTLMLGDRALYDNPGTTLRAIHAKHVLAALRAKSGPKQSTTESMLEDIWQNLASPCHYRKVKVRGVVINMEEQCYAAWIGYQANLLMDSWGGDGRGAPSSPVSLQLSPCPLCGARGLYSTSHALVSCKNNRMVQMRTTMLEDADRLLGESPIRVATSRYVTAEETQQRAVINDGEGDYEHLRRAGEYLLDGNINAMRGVPLKAMAEWMVATGSINSTSVKKGEVFEVLRGLSAQVMVDGLAILEEYKQLVHDAGNERAGEREEGQSEEVSG